MSATRQTISLEKATMRKALSWGLLKPKQSAERGNKPKLDYLQRVDIFKGLTSEEIERLAQGLTMRECVPGTLFFAPDDSTERLFILKAGHVELYRLTASGKRLVTRRLGPGAIFGEMGLLGQTMQGGFAEATEDALVCTGTREDVLRLLKEFPEVAVRLLETIGAHLKLLEERLEQAAFSPVKVRLASFVLANMDSTTGLVTGFTHAEIGDTIGALRQTVTEALSEMQDEGLVEIGHKRIRVNNPKGLEEIVQGQGIIQG